MINNIKQTNVCNRHALFEQIAVQGMCPSAY